MKGIDKDVLSPDEKREIDEMMRDLREGDVPIEPKAAAVQIFQANAVIEALRLRIRRLKKVARSG